MVSGEGKGAFQTDENCQTYPSLADDWLGSVVSPQPVARRDDLSALSAMYILPLASVVVPPT